MFVFTFVFVPWFYLFDGFYPDRVLPHTLKHISLFSGIVFMSHNDCMPVILIKFDLMQFNCHYYHQSSDLPSPVCLFLQHLYKQQQRWICWSQRSLHPTCRNKRGEPDLKRSERGPRADCLASPRGAQQSCKLPVIYCRWLSGQD